MLFNSIDFAVFLPIFFMLYWFIFKKLTSQNTLIFLASYLFYGWWDWRFLFLIFFSTLIDFFIGLRLKKAEELTTRRFLLAISLVMNLGFLGFFKYYNFFIDSFENAFSFFGKEISISSLNIILPVGISFYTFQTLSYSIDVYRKKLEPTSNFIAFAAFVSFFPQLVAGPIERATNLLPQFFTSRSFDFDKAKDGLRQILWGLLKKIVIADNCARFANDFFNNSDIYPGSSLLLGALFFTFQIYGDFSGYSDIAIGTSRLFGFNLMKNFSFPYFSRDMGEFWRRWHISLSTWFRDYLYIPLGGSRGSKWNQVRNIYIIFIVSGFWHGANWTFIIWGLLNALFFTPLFLLNKNRVNTNDVAEGSNWPTFRELFSMISTFSFVMLAWVFFRADNVSHAISYLNEIFSSSLFTVPKFSYRKEALKTILLIILFVLIEWFGRSDEYAIEKIINNWTRFKRWVFYYALIIIIISYTVRQEEFIYFQF